MPNQVNKIFVTGIGTDVGKTIVSAILVQALGYDYWKPIQAGNLDQTDSMMVKNLIDRDDVNIHKEYLQLTKALSPHAAAKIDGISISLDDIQIPDIHHHGMIIEGAGGVMVPLNDQHCMIDIIEKCKASVVIVSKHYLGSINHSLLTFEVLKSRNIPVLGWVFNGTDDPATEEMIMMKSNQPKLFSMYSEIEINLQIIKKYSQDILNRENREWIDRLRGSI